MIIILLLIALAPGIFLVWYFYHRDSYEPEPKLKIVKIFIIGGVLVIPAAVAEMGLMSLTKINTNVLFHILVLSFLIIAPVEELLKYYAVRRWIYKSTEFDEAMDGIVYAVAASLGFATVENIMYVTQFGIVTGIMRAFLAVPGHAFFGAVMGSYIGRAKFRPDKETKLIITGITLAIFCHGLYDFLILIRNAFSSMVILLLGILFLWTRIQLKKAAIESRIRVKIAEQHTP